MTRLNTRLEAGFWVAWPVENVTWPLSGLTGWIRDLTTMKTGFLSDLLHGVKTLPTYKVTCYKPDSNSTVWTGYYLRFRVTRFFFLPPYRRTAFSFISYFEINSYMGSEKLNQFSPVLMMMILIKCSQLANLFINVGPQLVSKRCFNF